MNRLFIKKIITAGLFLVFLFVFSFLNISKNYQPIKAAVKKTEVSSLKEYISNIEYNVNENIYGKYKFVEAYGYIQKLMDKNEVSNFEVVKDTGGKLHFTYFANKPNPTEHLVAKLKDFQSNIKNPKTKLLYLMTPDKYVNGYTKFPKGIPYNYNNETADQFLNQLKLKKIDSVDLREGILESGIKGEDLFFNTDHHWKIETAFWGFSKLVKDMNKKYSLKLDKDNFYTDINNYNIVKYNNVFVGSMGRKTGKYYAGADDFSLIYPKFKTNYDFYFENSFTKGTLTGRFEESLVAINPIRKYDPYGIVADKYFSYLYGNQPFAHIHNKDNPNGLKVLFIKDSLAVPLISFFSTTCSDIYLIDPRFYKKDVLNFINNTKLDFVVVSYSPQNLVDGFFKF
ncbi:DHHW family protein [Clostridium sp. MB40-C1]|uniref:DHHW family protein n=1 Tax=Clostridium sp. MB40-C1 TaxID=3070996 RepID=UPI0027E01DD7|nr:DHHW family protein [Clostridium sp. MB40-C1]WMJ79268.1 DHHW family protein [Clostridium sp. MB40-C1]